MAVAVAVAVVILAAHSAAHCLTEESLANPLRQAETVAATSITLVDG